MGCSESKHAYLKNDHEASDVDGNESLRILSWREHPQQDFVGDTSIDRKERTYWKDVLEWTPREETKSQEVDNVELLILSDDDNSNYKKLHKRIINGDLEASLPPEKNSIRIFLSSTFDDYGEERNLLLKDVLPYLKLFGSKFGVEVILREMRWGISDQAVKENRTIELCMNEIENCRNVSIGPFFCLMLGNRYGYRPAPPMLSMSEYVDALRRAREEQNERILTALESSYRLDENLQPPSYVIFTSKFDERKNKSVDDDVQEELLADFFDPPSVTEQEVLNGFLTHKGNSGSSLSVEKVGIFHRHIENVGDPPSPIYYDEFKERLDDLKLRSRSFAEANSACFHQYRVPSLEESGMDRYLLEFANDFCQWIIKSIQGIAIKRASASERASEGDPSTLLLLREISSHHDHAQRAFVGREEIVKKLVQHCEAGKGAVVLRGSSGTGKTTLLGQVAQRITTASPDGPVIVLLRFLGTTPASSTSEAVAASMLQQLAMAFPEIASNALSKEDADTMRSAARFLKLVRAISSRGKRIVMIIDSLDQLDSSDPGRNSYESWLPTLFGAGVLSNVAILLSALPDHLESIEVMPFHHIEELPQFTMEEGEEMLDRLCQNHARGLEEKQRADILKQFSHDQSTLFLTIAFLQSLRWKSWDTDMEIPKNVKGQIALLIKQLSEDFGPNLVRALVSHLTLTPGGMNVDELREVVSIDEDVLVEVFKWHRSPDGLVPPLLIFEIIGRLEPYLVTRKVDDLETRFWYHRAFWEAAEAVFLSSAESITTTHMQAIEFYSKQPTYVSDSGMKINCRKMRQLPRRLRELEAWPALGDFLTNNPEALTIELDSEVGQARYASYWRSLKEGNGDTEYNVEIALSSFALSGNELINEEHVFLIGDFLKEYFNSYEASLKVFMVALQLDFNSEDIFEQNFRITDSRQLDCMSRIGDVYTRLSQYDEAYKWLFKSYSELKRNVGEEHNATLRVLMLLSRLMKDWGRYKESLNYDTQLYDLSLKKFGEHDERVADAARQLARTHYLSGRYQVAIGYYAKNLTIRKLLYGDQHPQTAVALNCLGMANKVLGNYEEGLKYCKQAYEVKLELYGKNHSDTAVTIDNIGSLYHLNGMFDEAMECYEEAWEIKKVTLGEDHADTIMMYGQIGRLYHDKGELDKALPLLEMNVRVRTEILDRRHPQIAVAKNALAAILVDPEEAFKLAKESVELRSDVLGARHPYTAFAYDTLAIAELGRGNVDAAETAAEISADIRTDVLGPSHPRCAVAHITLAKVRSAQGQYEEALDEARKAKGVNDAALREGHPFRKLTDDLLRDIITNYPPRH